MQQVKALILLLVQEVVQHCDFLFITLHQRLEILVFSRKIIECLKIFENFLLILFILRHFLFLRADFFLFDEPWKS